MNSELKREIILEHFQNPVNKNNDNVDNYGVFNTRNPNCIDNLDLYILYDNDKIKDIKFMGEACAISTASTSIMIKNLIGKSITEAKKYIAEFTKMVEEQPYDEEILNEGIVFSDIYKQNNRKNCALLPYKGILKAINEYENK